MTRHDYLPFGEEIGAGTGGRTFQQGYVADGTRQQFTGHKRDGETGLDFMQARYYSGTQGRFTSVDLVAGTRTDPQSLNLYAYCLNNPLRYTDPSGHAPVDIGVVQTNNEAYAQLVFAQSFNAWIRTLQAQRDQVVQQSARLKTEDDFAKFFAQEQKPQTDPTSSTTPNSTAIPQSQVEGYGAAIEKMLEGNADCKQFVDSLFGALRPSDSQFKMTFSVAFAAVSAPGTFQDATGQLEEVAETVPGHFLTIRLDFDKIKAEGPSSLNYVVMHEVAHAVSAAYSRFAGLNSHEDMAKAAYQIGGRMGLVPEGVPPPRLSEKPKDAADRYNSILFQQILYNACSPK